MQASSAVGTGSCPTDENPIFSGCGLHFASRFIGQKRKDILSFFPAIWCAEGGIFLMKMIRQGVFRTVRALTLAAMLVAMSVVIGIFCKTFMNFAGGLFRVTFENLPIILSGILFGPIVGGLVGAASDLVSYLLSPQIYPPNLIVTAGAFAIGLVSGIVARLVRRRRDVQVILSGSIAHIVGSMVIKTIGLYQFYGILVLWRVPLYLVIASVEILILCFLFRRKSFCRLIERL